MDPMMQMGGLGMFPPQSPQGPMQAGPGVPMGGTPPISGPMNGGDAGPLLAMLMQLMGGGGGGMGMVPPMGMGGMGGPPMGPTPPMMPGLPPGGMQPPAGGPPMMM